MKGYQASSKYSHPSCPSRDYKLFSVFATPFYITVNKRCDQICSLKSRGNIPSVQSLGIFKLVGNLAKCFAYSHRYAV